jgi:exonuclease III
MHWLNFSLVLFGLTFGLVNGDTQCPTVPSTPSDRRSDKNTFRLMQYNVEWLFTDYYSNAKCPGSGCPWVNSTEASTHMDWVSKVITDLNPDYVNWCEVEGCDELNELVEQLGSGYNPYLIKGTDSSTGQNVGLITRIDPVVNLYRDETRYTYPIPGSKCGYTGAEGTSGVSKHYITELEVGGFKIAVIGLHLLAYPTDSTRCAEREAQAMVAQQIALKYLQAGYEVIVLGDLNDFDGQVLDSNNSVPTSQVLEILKCGGQLVTTTTWVPQESRYTNWWDKDGSCASTPNEFSMIDHILVTPGLASKVKGAFVYHGYEEFCGTYNSDHYPVIVDFDFKR